MLVMRNVWITQKCLCATDNAQDDSQAFIARVPSSKFQITEMGWYTLVSPFSFSSSPFLCFRFASHCSAFMDDFFFAV